MLENSQHGGRCYFSALAEKGIELHALKMEGSEWVCFVSLALFSPGDKLRSAAGTWGMLNVGRNSGRVTVVSIDGLKTAAACGFPPKLADLGPAPFESK